MLTMFGDPNDVAHPVVNCAPQTAQITSGRSELLLEVLRTDPQGFFIAFFWSVCTGQLPRRERAPIVRRSSMVRSPFTSSTHEGGSALALRDRVPRYFRKMRRPLSHHRRE